MDQYGSQDFIDDMEYLKMILEEEPGIMELLYSDVVLESQNEQFPGSAAAGAGCSGAGTSTGQVPVANPGIGSWNEQIYFNRRASHHQQPSEDINMQNGDLPTWLGHYSHDNPPLQELVPFSSNHHIPIDATPAPPLPAASSPQLVPLPPSLETPPRASSSSFYNYFTGLSTAADAPPPRSTVEQAPAVGKFSVVYPSVQVGSHSHVFSCGSETAGITAPAALPQKVAGAAPDQPVNLSAGASNSTPKAPLPPVVDRKRKGLEIVELDDDSEIRESATTKRKATEFAKAKRIRNAAMHNLAERIRESATTKRKATESAKAKRIRNAAMHNLAERRRRHKLTDRLQVLFDLTPDCNKGNKDDLIDKVGHHLISLQEQVDYLTQQLQMSRASQQYGMMYPYNYMPPSAIGNSAPAATGSTFPVPIYQAPPVFPPNDPRAPVTLPLAEYQQLLALRQMQMHMMPPPQMPLAQPPQNQEAEQPAEPSSGLEEAGNHQSG